jgi:hypothetical protein
LEAKLKLHAPSIDRFSLYALVARSCRVGDADRTIDIFCRMKTRKELNPTVRTEREPLVAQPFELVT